MGLNADYLDGMRAFDAGQPFDPKQRGQWRRGYERARENGLRNAKAWAQTILDYEGTTFPVDRRLMKRHLAALLAALAD